MTAVVVNHLDLRVPVSDLRETVEREFPPVFQACGGFRQFSLVENGEHQATVVIVWDSLEAAERGAGIIGPTLFARYIAPFLAAEQDRRSGLVLVECGAAAPQS